MSGPTFADLSPGVVVEGPILPEPVEVLALVPMGTSMKVIGKGLRTGQVRDPILDAAQLAQLRVTPKDPLAARRATVAAAVAPLPIWRPSAAGRRSATALRPSARKHDTQ